MTAGRMGAAALVTGAQRKLIVSAVGALIILIVAVIILIVLYITRPMPEEIGVSRQALRVGTIRLTPCDLVEPIVGYGTARSMRTTNLTAEAAGTLIYRDESARDGQSVRAGQVLFRIDRRDYDNQIEGLEEQIKAQQALLEQLDVEEATSKEMLTIAERQHAIAKEEYQRVADLYSQKLAPKVERNLAESNLQQAKQALEEIRGRLDSIVPRRQALQATLRAYQAQKRQAELNLSRCTLKVPFDGQIVMVTAEVGQTVQPGVVLAVLTDPKQIEVPCELPASVRGRVKVGANATMEPENNQSGSWSGPVTRLDAQIDPTSRTFKAYVVVDNPLGDVPLVQGAFLKVTVTGPTYKSVLAVPRSAVREGKLFVANDGHADVRHVKVRQFIGDLAVIDEGVRDGEEVITTNLDSLSEGALVTSADQD